MGLHISVIESIKTNEWKTKLNNSLTLMSDVMNNNFAWIINHHCSVKLSYIKLFRKLKNIKIETNPFMQQKSKLELKCYS